jgi:hypothetical protein
LQPVAGQAGRAEAFQLAAWQALPVAAGGAAAVGLGGQAVQAALLCLARQAAVLQPVAGQAGRAGQAGQAAAVQRLAGQAAAAAGRACASVGAVMESGQGV